jgi:hypothetical protein
MLRSQGLTGVHYHGLLDEESKNVAHSSWVSGDADIMVATGAFGTGVDLGAVRLVVHMDEPYSMIDLAHESGRGGRDGLPSKHIILLLAFWQARVETCAKVAEYLSGLKCQRWVLQKYVDGCGLDCFSSGSERCDVCESMAARVQFGMNMADWLETSNGTTNLASQEMDLFRGMDGDIISVPVDEESPTKKLCMGMQCYLSRQGGPNTVMPNNPWYYWV